MGDPIDSQEGLPQSEEFSKKIEITEVRSDDKIPPDSVENPDGVENPDKKQLPDEKDPNARQAQRILEELKSIDGHVQSPSIKSLYRGIWADEIKEGDKIPVVFGDGEKAKSSLLVDTAWISGKTANFTKEKVDEICKTDGNDEVLRKWVSDNGFNIDPDLLHRLIYVQAKMSQLLEIGSEDKSNERANLYFSKDTLRLSELVGKAMCSERTVVGKLLLDRLGINSSLLEGVAVDDKNLAPVAHAILILDDPTRNGSLIFDIGRPARSKDGGVVAGGYPQLSTTDHKLDYATFHGKDNYVVPAKSIYNDSVIYYGVGNDSILEDVNFAE